MQPLKNYINPIRGDEDMGNSNQGPIDSVLWDGMPHLLYNMQPLIDGYYGNLIFHENSN